MNARIPDWLRYEARHKVEWLRDGYERLRLRETINDHPKMITAVTCLSVYLLIVVLVLVLRPTPRRGYEKGRQAWFYDLNTGELFASSGKKAGPIEAPSGPLPDGGAAAFRANVYSYVLDPTEAELFVGFLERPDPNAGSPRHAPDRSDFDEWARRTLIRRIDSDDWVPAAGAVGQDIMAEMTRPNEKGQTPIYQVPRQ